MYSLQRHFFFFLGKTRSASQEELEEKLLAYKCIRFSKINIVALCTVTSAPSREGDDDGGGEGMAEKTLK